MQGRCLEVVADVDDLGTQAMRWGQVSAAAAAAPPEAAADVAAAAPQRPRQAAAAEPAALALAPAPAAALDARLSGLEELDENVAVSLGARPVERGELVCGVSEKETPREHNTTQHTASIIVGPHFKKLENS